MSLNLAGRDLDGTVDPGDYEKVRDELMDRLGSYVDPKTGRKPVKSIARREEVFKGKFADQAPDIMMVPAEGYPTHAKSAIEDADWVSGDHRKEGVIVAVGLQVRAFEQPPALIDMAPTLVAALDAPTAVKPTGRILHEIVGSAELTEREVAPGDAGSTAAGPAIPGMTIPGMGGESAVNETEADEMEEHLRRPRLHRVGLGPARGRDDIVPDVDRARRAPEPALTSRSARIDAGDIVAHSSRGRRQVRPRRRSAGLEQRFDTHVGRHAG